DGRPALPEREFPAHLPVAGVDRQRRQPSHENHVPYPLEGAGNGRRIAGLLVSRLPEGLAVGEREGHDPAMAPRPDIHEQLVPLDDRGAAGAEIALGDLVVTRQRPRPALRPIIQRHAVEITGGTEEIDVSAMNQRNAARALIRIYPSRVSRRKRLLPVP